MAIVPISCQFFVASMLVFQIVLRFCRRRKARGGRMDGARVLRVDDGIRAVQHVVLLVSDGRHVQRRAGQADVRVHLAWAARSAITGSATAALATRIGTIAALVSAALLELAVFTVMRFPMRDGGATPMSGQASRPRART
jgi:hypothetical protein